MPSMSYCRFQNTLQDLRACDRDLQDKDLSELSEDERAAAIKLIRVCKSIVDAYPEYAEPRRKP